MRRGGGDVDHGADVDGDLELDHVVDDDVDLDHVHLCPRHHLDDFDGHGEHRRDDDDAGARTEA